MSGEGREVTSKKGSCAEPCWAVGGGSCTGGGMNSSCVAETTTHQPQDQADQNDGAQVRGKMMLESKGNRHKRFSRSW